MHYSEIRELSRKLRKNPTPEEYVLWQNLRGRKLKGCKFLRQYPIIYESDKNNHFFYIPDFYCASEKLIIELDGPIHDHLNDRDNRRDEILESEGYRILRIKNDELSDINNVLAKIEAMFINPVPITKRTLKLKN